VNKILAYIFPGLTTIRYCWHFWVGTKKY